MSILFVHYGQARICQRLKIKQYSYDGGGEMFQIDKYLIAILLENWKQFSHSFEVLFKML
jgi:hypothetical protein